VVIYIKGDSYFQLHTSQTRTSNCRLYGALHRDNFCWMPTVWLTDISTNLTNTQSYYRLSLLCPSYWAITQNSSTSHHNHRSCELVLYAQSPVLCFIQWGTDSRVHGDIYGDWQTLGRRGSPSSAPLGLCRFFSIHRQTETQRWQQHSSAGGLTSLTDSLLNQYTACNLEQVVNLLHTRVNSVSYPLQDG